MTDMKRVKDCPDCGTSLQFAGGCYICPNCGHGKCGRFEAVTTGLAFFISLVLISLMGWSVVDYPTLSPTPQLVDKEMLRLYTAEAMAKYTAEINARFEQQARSGK